MMERQGAGGLPPTPADAVPFRVRDESENVHYPASGRDLLAVMRLLPLGLLTGMNSIELCLGSAEQASSAVEPHEGTGTDPFTGRYGTEVLPGIYQGHYLGHYHRGTGRIRLFAYVYQPDMAHRELWELYLRLQMLATFMHELGHHKDCTMRVARGRWLADDYEKREMYAERMEHAWTHRHVVPYLERAYSTELAALQDWMRQHGGTSISLGALAGDRHVTAKGGLISVTSTAFSVAAAFRTLTEQVAKGESRTTTHLEFARGLHYSRRYTEALACIGRVLTHHPDHLEALTLQAHVYLDDEQYEQAGVIAEKVLSLDETVEDAWWTLADVHEARQDWPALLATATRSIEMHGPDREPRPYAFTQRAKAKVELGDLAGAEADLSNLETMEGNSTRPSQRMLRLAREIRADIAMRIGKA